MSQRRGDLWQSRARDELQRAIDAVNDQSGSADDVFAGIGLAELAYRIFLGERPESDWPVEPECICPPDLLARGGFKGGCPVHG